MKYIFALLFCISIGVNAEIYPWKVERVIDGDTVIFNVDFLPPPLSPYISVRVDGVDTPEKALYSKCEKENELAQRATEYTKEIINKGNSIMVILKDWDKYGGRVDGDIIVDDVLLSQSLIEKGLAREYHGEAKKSWSE